MPQGHLCVANRDTVRIVLTASKPTKIPQILKTWGDHIKKRRLELNLTQLEIGRLLGVSECSVYNWENNRDEPQLSKIQRIIEFLRYVPALIPSLTLGQKITAYRVTHSLNQQELASQLRIDPSTLGRYERDEVLPKGKIKARISSFLDKVMSSS